MDQILVPTESGPDCLTHAVHQQPEVNYLPCFENDDLPCRLHVFSCSLQGKSALSKEGE